MRVHFLLLLEDDVVLLLQLLLHTSGLAGLGGRAVGLRSPVLLAGRTGRGSAVGLARQVDVLSAFVS